MCSLTRQPLLTVTPPPSSHPPNRKVKWWMRSDKVCRNVNMVRDRWQVQMWACIMWMWSEDFFHFAAPSKFPPSLLHRVYSCMKSCVLQSVNITEPAVKQTEPVCQDVVRLRHDIMHGIKKKKSTHVCPAGELSGWDYVIWFQFNYALLGYWLSVFVQMI